MAEKACHGFGSTTQVGLTQALGAQIVDKAQFRQTIIGTGVVGAVFGAMPVLALLFSAFTHGLGSEPSRSLLAMSLDLGLIFFGCIAFCILCFGLVPWPCSMDSST